MPWAEASIARRAALADEESRLRVLAHALL
jgi:hypothetical protein